MLEVNQLVMQGRTTATSLIERRRKVVLRFHLATLRTGSLLGKPDPSAVRSTGILEGRRLSMKKVRLLAILAAVAALLLPTTAQAATVIRAHTASNSFGYKWKPHEVSISRGTRVVWRNPTSTNHTVTSYGGNWSKSATITPGTSTSFTFRSAGTFKFRCTIHSTLSNGVCSGMCGKVVVG